MPFVAAESPLGWELAQEWINSSKENIASAGWATLSSIISTVPNENIDNSTVKSLVQRVVQELHQSPDRVRYTMNGFLLSVGAYIPEWTEEIKAMAKNLVSLQSTWAILLAKCQALWIICSRWKRRM